LEKVVDVDVVTQGVIQRPRGEVASYVADPDNAPRWYKNITSVEWKSPRPLKVGSLGDDLSERRLTPHERSRLR
jgi:hypothetical protein